MPRSSSPLPNTKKKPLNLPQIDRQLQSLTASARVDWALSTFGKRIILASSFGAQSAVLLHLTTALRPRIPVVLVDTGYLFPETYQFIDQLSERLALNLQVYRAPISAAWQEARHGKLWEQGLKGIEQYNQINKVEPFQRAIQDFAAKAWITGIRRDQSTSRESISCLAVRDGVVKVQPIFDWTDRDVYNYLQSHDLPYHPLWEQGYISIGDWHSSHKLTDAGSKDAVRFNGLKRECGLHEGNQELSTDYVI